VAALGKLFDALVHGAVFAENVFKFRVQRFLFARRLFLFRAQRVQIFALFGRERRLFRHFFQFGNSGCDILDILFRIGDLSVQLLALFVKARRFRVVRVRRGAVLRNIHLQHVIAQVALVAFGFEFFVLALAAVGLVRGVAFEFRDLFFALGRGGKLAVQMLRPFVEHREGVFPRFQRLFALGKRLFQRALLFGKRGDLCARLLKTLAQRFHFPGGLRLFLIQKRFLFGERGNFFAHLFDIGERLFDIALVGKKIAAVCAARAARHRARRGNDIAVERDHAERVRKFFGNFVGVGDIVHDQGVAQQIIDDIIVIFVVAHEFGRKPQSAAFFERAAGKIRFVARL